MALPILAIANRGEIAVRIARTAGHCGWAPVVLLGDPDLNSYPAREIGRVVPLGPAGNELEPDIVVHAALDAGAAALHPGYGFLSERPEFSRLCQEAGITFVGPSPRTLELAGDKIATREIARQLGLPLIPASDTLDGSSDIAWEAHASLVGYPLMVKAAEAGGGRGLRVAREPGQLDSAIRSALNEADMSGATTLFFLESYLEAARHVEVQVAGDGVNAVALGDRDCSLQRRHQKVIEEAPAPGLDDATRDALWSDAIHISEAIGLRGLATVEFLMDRSGNHFFMEINPRLQVEHTVTEEVTGLDLVAVQLDLATGGPLPEPVSAAGHAIQARLYAEDPFHQFLPSPGRIRRFDVPRDSRLRVDTGYKSGDSVPSQYDPMIAKFITFAPDRDAAINDLVVALSDIHIAGIATNRPWLIQLLQGDPRYRKNQHDLATADDIVLVESAPAPDILGPAVRSYLKFGHSTERTAWSSAGAFRIVGSPTVVLHGDEVGGWQQDIDLAGPDEIKTTTTIDPISGGFELSTPAGRWLVRLGPAPAATGSGRIVDGTLRAPMPGTVRDVTVKPGQQVNEGESVAVFEAMKIEISLAAPFNGLVTEVHAAAGDLVGTNQPIVTITESNDEDGAMPVD